MNVFAKDFIDKVCFEVFLCWKKTLAVYVNPKYSNMHTFDKSFLA